MKRGVILIAAGNPYYGQLALTLCMSIKHICPTMDVTIAHYGDALNRILPYMHLFDGEIKMPAEMVQGPEGKSFCKPKVHLYELSPYDESIFIDADCLWFPRKSIVQLFDQLKGNPVTMACRNVVKLATAAEKDTQWATPAELMGALGHDGDFYNVASELIYFEKGKAAKSYFATAKNFFDKPGLAYTRFAGSVPDELPFQMAFSALEMKPHAVPFVPFYWEHAEKKMARPAQLYDNWWGYSMGGRVNSAHAETIYNNLANWYYNQYGIPYNYRVKNKKDFLPERSIL